MVSAKRLQKRHAAVAAALQSHGNVHAAAKKVGARVSFVQKWYTSYKKTGNVLDKQRTGRPSAFTAALRKEAEQLLLVTQSCTKVTSQLIQEHKLPATTHRSTLYKNVVQQSKSIKCGPEVMVPHITTNTAVSRLSFARLHMKRETEWCNVMAIDSCMFRIGRVPGSAADTGTGSRRHI